MVPFDNRSAFQTSGLRFGTPAITTRGLKEDQMEWIVELIDKVLSSVNQQTSVVSPNNSVITSVREEVNRVMMQYPLYAW